MAEASLLGVAFPWTGPARRLGRAAFERPARLRAASATVGLAGGLDLRDRSARTRAAQIWAASAVPAASAAMSVRWWPPSRPIRSTAR